MKLKQGKSIVLKYTQQQKKLLYCILYYTQQYVMASFQEHEVSLECNNVLNNWVSFITRN